MRDLLIQTLMFLIQTLMLAHPNANVPHPNANARIHLRMYKQIGFMMYSCTECEYSTEIKSNYTRHVKNKHRVDSVEDTIQSTKGYIVVDSKNVTCTHCHKRLLKSNVSRHLKRCKGVPTNTCVHCNKSFSTRHGKNNHSRTCRQEQKVTVNSHNTVTNSHNITTHNQTNNITIRFGNEDLLYLQSKREIDDRIDMVAQCLSDVLDLVYFNSDHPENQTIRKTNKKTDLIETRVSKNEWDHEESRLVIPKIKAKLETVLNVKCDMMNASVFKDTLYLKSARGLKSEEHILEKYNGIAIQADPDDMRRFLKEVESTCDMYRSACPNRKEFEDQANSVREFILYQAEAHCVKNFTIRNAESMYQAQLKKYSVQCL